MSASSPIAPELWHRSEMTRGARNGFMHRSRTLSGTTEEEALCSLVTAKFLHN
jgi:hypothetical protein